MLITVKGKQLDVGDALRGHIEQSLNQMVGKYFANPLEAQIVLSREAHLFRADISVHVGRDILVQGHATGADAHLASDSAIEHVVKRVRRHKRRLRDHNRDGAEALRAGLVAQAYVLAGPTDDHDEENGAYENGHAGQPMIIAEMTTEIVSLSVSDAVMKLDLGDLPHLLFRHAGHGGLNLVYRRADGNIGWIDPQGNANGKHANGQEKLAAPAGSLR